MFTNPDLLSEWRTRFWTDSRFQQPLSLLIQANMIDLQFEVMSGITREAVGVN